MGETTQSNNEHFSVAFQVDEKGNFTVDVKLLDPEMSERAFGFNLSEAPQIDFSMSVRDRKVIEGTSPAATHAPLHVDDEWRWEKETMKTKPDGGIETQSIMGEFTRTVYDKGAIMYAHSSDSQIAAMKTYFSPGSVNAKNQAEHIAYLSSLNNSNDQNAAVFERDGYVAVINSSTYKDEESQPMDIKITVFTPQNDHFIGTYHIEEGIVHSFIYETFLDDGKFSNRYDTRDIRTEGTSFKFSS